MIDWIRRLPWWLLVAGSLTLGLAPFQPMPHLFEKIIMLSEGNLHRPIDVFDLFMHGTFPLLLIIKVFLASARRQP